MLEGNSVGQPASDQTMESQAAVEENLNDPLNRIYAQEPAPTTTNTESMDAPPTPPITISNESIDDAPAKKRFSLKLWHKIVIGVFAFLLILSIPIIALTIYTLSIVRQMQVQANEVQAAATATYDQFKSQNLVGTEKGVKEISQKLTELRGTYTKLSYLNVIPFVRAYYQDGIHGFNAADAGVSAGLKSVQALEPYADVLGFTGQGSFAGGTAEDRLKVLLQTLQKVTPQLDNIGGDLNKMETELAAIDAKRYPESFQGKPIRSRIEKYQEVTKGATLALTQFRPVLEQIPAVAGADGRRRKYFVLFQNDNELRPTGGFLTAFSVINVDGGKVSPEKSDDIYQLDKKLKSKVPIPEILGKYLTTEKYWNLRDMNTSPDFKASMQQFLQYYKQVPDESHDIDGVIAVDTRVLTDLIKVIGPINVNGAGTFTAENTPKCDCPQIIYALSEIADRPTSFVRPDRKQILGPMMQEVLTHAYSAPKAIWPQLFTVLWNNIQSRHVQMYFFDEKAEKAAELAMASGEMTKDPKADDFLAVIDANLGGAKSNLFINSDIAQEVSVPSNGQITKKVTITYRNTRKGDNCNLEAGLLCLNATLRDWNRLYLPKGAKLTNSQGYKTGTVKQYDEGDFTVIDGEFSLDPLSQAKLIVEYTVPYTDTKNYRIKMWKQGGVLSIPVMMDVNGNQEKITLDKDTVYEAKF